MGRPPKPTKANVGQKRKADVLDDPVWIIDCPAKPAGSQRGGIKDVFQDRDHPGVEELAIDFDIRPGSQWSNIKRYTHVKYLDHTFSPRDYIFVNKTDPPPEPPPQDALPEVVLKYQRDNMWVGRLQQAKADSAQKVWLRVFWLYWPEELPMGAQHYHGQSELVLSNYTDIIDATTISGPADISYWDEMKDGDEDRDLNALYWRQTFDVSKMGPKQKGGLSVLRKHCTCRKEYNPDEIMFKCPNSVCGIWNHLECLRDELRGDLETRLEKRSLQGYLERRAAALDAEQQEKQRSLGDTIAVGIAHAASNLLHTTAQVFRGTPDPANATSIEASNALLKSPKGKRKSKHSNDSRLVISISNSGLAAEEGNGAVVATVKLLPAKNGESKEVKEWMIKLDCLKCDQALD